MGGGTFVSSIAQAMQGQVQHEDFPQALEQGYEDRCVAYTDGSVYLSRHPDWAYAGAAVWVPGARDVCFQPQYHDF
eukprot:14142090-Alexandrium_andersonii.AAC.1